MEIVRDRLENRPTARLMSVIAHLGTLLLVVLEHKPQRQEDKRHDDTKGTVRPTPAARLVHKVVPGQRTREGRTNERRLRKGNREGSVAQSRRIGHEDLQDQEDGVVADQEQHVAGCIAGRAVAGGQNDHANHVHENRRCQTLSTTPQVQRFGDRQLDHASNNRRKNIGCRNRRGFLEFRVCCHLGRTGDREFQSQHEK